MKKVIDNLNIENTKALKTLKLNRFLKCELEKRQSIANSCKEASKEAIYNSETIKITQRLFSEQRNCSHIIVLNKGKTVYYDVNPAPICTCLICGLTIRWNDTTVFKPESIVDLREQQEALYTKQDIDNYAQQILEEALNGDESIGVIRVKLKEYLIKYLKERGR